MEAPAPPEGKMRAREKAGYAGEKMQDKANFLQNQSGVFIKCSVKQMGTRMVQ